jgi:hypothetical protein
MGRCVASPQAAVEHALQPSICMEVSLEYEQVNVLRELLESSLKELRLESARADSHDYRQMLHHREAVVEALLRKLATEESIAAV